MRQLPDRPDLHQPHRQARELQRAARSADPSEPCAAQPGTAIRLPELAEAEGRGVSGDAPILSAAGW